MLRRIAAAAGIGLVAAAAAHGAGRPLTGHPFPRFGSGCARADFRSGGVTVRAERCGPASGPRAVVVLHGCGGFDTFDHQVAADLPAQGIATLYVDYFAPTPPTGNRGFCGGGGGAFGDPFPAWEQVTVDAAKQLRQSYKRVGVVGWSLGGGVALNTAVDTRAFDAAAVFSAGAHESVLARAHSLPPTIFLSGGRHDAIPVDDAIALYRAARAAHVPSALYVYPNGTHSWKGAQGVAGRAQASAFLRRWLR